MVIDAKAPRRLPRGARPSPRLRIIQAERFKAPVRYPAEYAVVPKQLDMWGNDQYGDCVSAEEAFAKACYQPEIFLQAQTVIDWARDHGVLDGATLTEVLDAMQADGFQVGPQRYNDGPYRTVDYSSETDLRAAISTGPVKIAIDANALPSGAGNESGWYALGGGRYPNTDHCVSLCGYGDSSYLYNALTLPLPSALKSNPQGYLLYTWSTIGFVDHAWLQGTCEEAWIRQPTTVGVPPLGPTPPPPTPTPSGKLVLNVPSFQITGDLGHQLHAQAGALPPWLVLLIEALCGAVGHKR